MEIEAKQESKFMYLYRAFRYPSDQYIISKTRLRFIGCYLINFPWNRFPSVPQKKASKKNNNTKYRNAIFMYYICYTAVQNTTIQYNIRVHAKQQ